jgi:hypothetical protein
MSNSATDRINGSNPNSPPGTHDLVEAIARRVVELLDGRSPSIETQLLSALEVAQHFGVGRKWVYEQAHDLGAIRLGPGRRARMRFNPSVVEQRLNELSAKRSHPRGTKSASSEPPQLLPIYGRPFRR